MYTFTTHQPMYHLVFAIVASSLLREKSSCRFLIVELYEKNCPLESSESMAPGVDKYMSLKKSYEKVLMPDQFDAAPRTSKGLEV